MRVYKHSNVTQPSVSSLFIIKRNETIGRIPISLFRAVEIYSLSLGSIYDMALEYG